MLRNYQTFYIFANKRIKMRKIKRGRKPIEDKKLRVELWVRESKIKEKGGKPELQKALTQIAER